MTTCRDVADYTSDYLDRSLGWRRRAGMWRHLRQCDACRRYVEQFRLVVSSLRHLRRPPADGAAAGGALDSGTSPDESLRHLFRQLRR